MRGAIHPPSVDSRASQVVIVYLNELRRLLKNGSMTDSFAPREMLLRTLVERGKVKEARVVTNAEDRHFLLLRCVDDMILVDATHYCNIRGTCRNSTLWMSLSDSTPKRCAHMLRQYEFELLVNHSPAEGYVRRFLGGLTANCGVTWTDIAF